MAEPTIHNLEIDGGPDPSVQEFIDNTLAALVNELSRSPAEANISITLKRRASPIACIINPTTGALEASPRIDTYRKYSWPGKTAYEAWKFTVILRILAILDQVIRTGQLISKRDIYYIDPEFFRMQYIVDGIIDDLAYTIGVNRTALNVEAAAKGLVTGDFRLIRGSHILIDAQSATEDSLIPRIEDGDEIDISRVRWVLVIEKEAVFHRLARVSYHTRALAGEGIMVTGKGYPDFMTRTFLRAMSDSASKQSRRPPRFYALTDGDPHGMAIMSTYKYGSVTQLHQNARLSIPRLQWLGLRVSDIIAVPEVLGDTALLSLTMRDRKKIMAMLRNSPVWASDGPEPEWRAELQRMLVLNLKAEIEILYGCQGGLEGWINRRMFRQE
ncbi:Winged helix-turn-helix transcription repressor DNA-binding [Penicillium chrysogenum]|uniref:DNA topoisomerase (ATP-hydrolyzing) n=1 Tax=Penicillium chrysogenum TaxID=5076 RepID=A0ABQ8WTW8_PENCH|nr:Winged helix-turn-helix transcription repressor DNA-binding [Penicillium chrysogenum]KAJ5229982.1 Winged helix-turn-helix transcription repressor DNA-binding [Penicillium chrysogenum]KAJ5271656.1 Winged helix-turn-helix transcription repressor DNA-binding [Penicillium chrysogenum]KAJ5282124.1 Winged helix-turn-helix transcription repressor DNA-binding [Penicillium chrysogenum]KAJ6141044.1 Winged helix-turn-helix transcription repressor DNA-binding [Penicillium chrysogenum]